MSLADLKREARSLGISWASVQAVAREMRQSKIEAMEPEREIRREAWERFTNETCWGWWGSGFPHRFKRAFSDGDRTLIRGFDVLADGLAYKFPQLRGANDPAEALFEMLQRPCPRLPSMESCYVEALRYLSRRHRGRTKSSRKARSAEFKYGANAHF